MTLNVLAWLALRPEVRPVPIRESTSRLGTTVWYVAPVSLIGVTLDDAADAGPVPIGLVALTVKVYGVPFVRPRTVQLRTPAVVQVLPSGDEVAV